MFKIKNWIFYLKNYEPKILAVSEQNSLIKNASYISDNTSFKKDTLYIGMMSSVAYRFLSIDGMTLFLVNDNDSVTERTKFGNNCVVIFPQTTNPEDLYEKCRDYIGIQEEVVENTQKLMDCYLADGSLQAVLDCAADIIENPLMVIDNGYRVICSTDSKDCDDLQWMGSIEMGYCSYEFVSQFNKLSEIDAIQKESSPVLAGCMMSPMRRGISKMFVDKKPVGYLLAIESSRPFDEGKIELLEVASKLVSKLLETAALKSGQDIYRSTWDALINAIERIPGSDELLAEYISNSGMHLNSRYYLLLLSLDNYDMTNYQMAPLYENFHAVFPLCIFSYYKKNVILLVEFPEEQDGIIRRIESREALLQGKNFKVAVSDPFYDFSDVKRYYDQVKRTESLMQNLRADKMICSYDDIRTYDMISSKLNKGEVPLHIREGERKLYEYDREHGTEYFKTLYSYIKNGKSLQGVADEMYIHKNTVSYRINRIKELFDLDLNNAEVRIGLYLAYQTMELMEMINGRDEV